MKKLITILFSLIYFSAFTQQKVDSTGGSSEAIMAINSDLSAGGWVKYYSNGVIRWLVGRNGIAEGGSNSGSELEISCWSDAGALVGAVLTIDRTGKIKLNTGLLPTSSAGLAPGVIYSDSGTLKIA